MEQGGESMSRNPMVLWAETKQYVFLTVGLADVKNPHVKLEPDGRFKFSGTGGSDNARYETDLELYGKLNVEGSKTKLGPRQIFCEIQKAEEGRWKRLLKKEGKAPAYIKADWNRWVDEDEEEENQGRGGYNNDYGMDSMGDFQSFGDSDDEDEELPDVNDTTAAAEEKLLETSKADDKEAKEEEDEEAEELPDTSKASDKTDEEELPSKIDKEELPETSKVEV